MRLARKAAKIQNSATSATPRGHNKSNIDLKKVGYSDEELEKIVNYKGDIAEKLMNIEFGSKKKRKASDSKHSLIKAAENYIPKNKIH
jgi:hypothetical protein